MYYLNLDYLYFFARELSFLKIATILLAAGLSRRMGLENKLLLQKSNLPLIKYTIDKLAKSSIGKLLIVLGHDADQVRSAIDDDSIETVYNAAYHTGMTSSIKAGVRALPDDIDAFMICLSDMPQLDKHHYDDLLQFHASGNKGNHISRPKVSGISGHPVIFDRCFADEILNCPDLDGCSSVIKNNISQLSVMESTNTAYIRDIDTPEDKKWLAT